MPKNVLSTETRTGFCRDQLRRNPDVTIAEVREVWKKSGRDEYMSSQVLSVARHLHRKEVETNRVAAKVVKVSIPTREIPPMSNGQTNNLRGRKPGGQALFCRNYLSAHPGALDAELQAAWNAAGNEGSLAVGTASAARNSLRGLGIRVGRQADIRNGRKTEERIVHATPKGESEILEDIEIKLDDLIFITRKLKDENPSLAHYDLLDSLKAARRAAILLQGED